MSLPGKKEKVMEGKRYINSVTPDTHCSVQENHPKVVCTYPRVLTNIDMRNIDSWQQEKCTNKKDKYGKTEKGRRKLGDGSYGSPCPIMNDIGNAYRVPKICSTLHVAAMLIQAREQQPNVPQLLRTKLNTLDADVKLKKQLSKNVSLPKSQSVFQELVSLDVSERSLEAQLKDTLNIRAEAMYQQQRPHDHEPHPTNVLNPEEYVSRATSTTTTNLSLACASVQPQQFTSHELGISKLIKDFM